MEIEGYTYIAHRLINRPWGPECMFVFARPDGTHIGDIISIPSMGVSNDDLKALVTAYLVKKKTQEDREANFFRAFDAAGPEIKKAVHWLICKIRQYPTATVAQATTAWNAEWADSLFTFDRFVAYVQKIAGGVTWDQFKTFAINKYFEGID